MSERRCDTCQHNYAMHFADRGACGALGCQCVGFGSEHIKAPSCDSPELASLRKAVEEHTAGWGHAQNLLDMVDELTYQLAEERNATANDRDPSYHEDKLRMENGILARLYADLGMVSESRGRRIVELESYAQSIAKECDDLRTKLDLANITIQMGDDLTTQQLEVIRELRAKLAEAARIHVESEAKHAYRVKELEAKLAEAEKQRDDYWHQYVSLESENVSLMRERNDNQERAEAAEALAAKNDARAKLLLADREAAEARVRELELSIKLIASGNGNIRTEQNR